MKKVFLAIIIILVTFSALHAENNSSLFEKASKAYTQKHYKEASDTYLKIISSGYEAPEVYFNLGNAFYKQNDYPSAIYYFEKANRFNPGDEATIFNLKLANTKIIDKTDDIPAFFLARWWRALYNTFSFDTWAIIGIVCFIAFLLSISFYLFSLSVKYRKLSFWIASALFLITILVFLFAQIQYNNAMNKNEAIIFTPALTAKSSPDASSTDLFVIHEGTKVRVTDKIGDWYEIKINSGSVGWVKKSNLKII
jgi:tetratricopeptide (TPR) repeat protein